MTQTKKPARSIALAAKVVHAALSAIRDNGGEMPVRAVLQEVEKRVEFDEWERERYPKTGYVRWESILHFFTIDCIKAGFLVKKQGTWFVTPEGEKALKLGPDRMLEQAREAYRSWKKNQPKPVDVEEAVDEAVDAQQLTFEQIEQLADDGLRARINSLNAYELQFVVAALLRGMGYYTPFTAPPGKDGGIDVEAYRDPLGTQSPRIKVQVKHRPTSPTGVQDVRQLMGLLQKEGDVGIFVSTGGFSQDAKSAARGSHAHVELMDLQRFIALWKEYYTKLTEADRGLLPLRPVYFLAPEEE
jgi:restriction system protein